MHTQKRSATRAMRVVLAVSRVFPATLAVFSLSSLVAMPVQAADPDVETIVMVRHGEKPVAGLGQLSCRGLNRALALPRLIEGRYGKPDAILAPNPARQKSDVGVSYDYVRPLATIEPTAIYFGLPVSASLGYAETDALRGKLLSPAFRHSLVVVAWEHRMIEQLAREVVTDAGGDPASVPRWNSPDYDSIYVLRVTRSQGAGQGAQMSVSFSVAHQGLNDLPTTCP
jgi:hypothetical protein